MAGLTVRYTPLDGSAQALGDASISVTGALQALNAVLGTGGACDPSAAGAYENMAKVWAAQVTFLANAVDNFGSGTSIASAGYRNNDAADASTYGS